MAEPLTRHFGAREVRIIATELGGAAGARFDATSFVRACTKGLDALALTARGWHVADVMHAHLPRPFSRAADVIVRSLPPPLARTDDFGFEPFRYMPHVFFVARYGLEHFEESMRAQYELTKRFTAEFSIRPFLERHAEATLARLALWATDRDPHVRRLVSEGTRPLLPWAPQLPAFRRDPRPVLALLDRLKDDPERYVQRSVANNLNDISKDHPDTVVEVCRRWLTDAPEGRRFIVGHALRTLVKRGHRDALDVLGVGVAPRVRVEPARFEAPRVRIGSTVRFSFTVTSTSAQSQEVLVDYAVHFVKADGGTSAKVFKLRRLTLPPRARVELGARVSMKVHTTRRPYAGCHRIEALLNGVAHPLGAFDVIAS